MDAIGLLSRHGNRVSGNGQYNLINLVRSSRWKIPNANLSAFFTDYCARLRESVDTYECPEPGTSTELPRAIANIMQKNQNETSVVFDLHMDYTRLMDDSCPASFLYLLISSIQQAINETYIIMNNGGELEGDDELDEMLCVVTGWPQPVVIRDSRPGHLAEDCFRYRYMFHFPCCRVESNTLSRLARRVYSNLRANNAMGMLHQTPIGDWDTILKPVINEPIPLYGSSEKPEYPPCFYIGLYGDLSVISMEAFRPQNGYDLSCLSIHEHSLVLRGALNTEEIESAGEDFSAEELLPIILYGCYGNNLCVLRESILDDEGSPTANVAAPMLSSDGIGVITEKTKEDILNELLPLVAPHRYGNRKTWIEIGKAIHHTYRGTDEGLSVWIGSTEKALEKSQTIPDFLEGSTIPEMATTLYSEFGERVYTTFKTVVWFAMEDNPEQYRNWHLEWSHPYMNRALTLQEDEIAKAIYCDLWLTYAVPGGISSTGTKGIYRFRDNRWSRVDGGYTIRLYITDDFKRRFEIQRANIYRSMAESHDEGFRERMDNLAKRISALIDKLGKQGVKNSIISALTDRLVVEDLESVMDSDGELTGLPNGIAEADYKQKTIRVRPGKPEDYISRTTLVRLNDRYTWNHPLVVEFTNWMRKMFPNEDMRNYVYKYLGSLWIAGNQDKILVNFSGETCNNSKSTFARCIFKAWGAYAIKFPTTGLTKGYSDSGSANPAWARLSGPRIAFVDETDEGEYFRSGPTKLVTGNDDFFGRKLYSDGGDLAATATVCVISNRVIPFKSPDDAIRKRFLVAPCISQWRDDNVPETEEEQYAQRVFKNDPNFINRVIHLSPALLWVSFQSFGMWAREGLRDKPREIIEATDAYWKENDIYRLYTSDRIEDGQPTDTVSLSQVYEDFEAWFARYNKGQHPPDRQTLRYHITQLWGAAIGGKWYGIRFAAQEDTNGPPKFDPEAVTRSVQAAIKNVKKTTTPKKSTPVITPPRNATPSKSPGKMVTPKTTKTVDGSMRTYLLTKKTDATSDATKVVKKRAILTTMV